MLPRAYRIFLLLAVSGTLSAAAQRSTADEAQSSDSAVHTSTKHISSKHNSASAEKKSAVKPQLVKAASDTPEHGDARDGGKQDGHSQSVYDFGLPTPDGNNLPLSKFKGKVLLIVNLASKSSYNAQLAGLQKLSDTFKDKGLVVIGVPSDDFGKAEPGTDADVARYYADAKVTFPVMQRSTLTGVHQLPLFGYLANNKAIPDDGIHWNYTKFLVDRKGKLIVRFPPQVEPDSLEMMATIQEVLDGTWKPKKPADARGSRPSAEDGEGPM